MARSSKKVSYAHFLTDLISLTAAMPLFAMSTCVVVQPRSHSGSSNGEAYAGDDGVPIMVGDKVLDGPWSRIPQMIAADEMGFEVEFGSVGAWMTRTRRLFGGVCIAIRQCAIGLWHAVGGHRCHAVDAAEEAGSMNCNSVRSVLGGLRVNR